MCPGNNEQVCPSGPKPSKSISKIGKLSGVQLGNSLWSDSSNFKAAKFAKNLSIFFRINKNFKII